MTRLLSLILLFLSISSYCWGQAIDSAKLDRYFEALESNNKFMGSVAVARDGKVIYTKSIGYRDLENQIKANVNTKYRIGSISKTFTTVLVFKAIEANLLSLKTPLSQYYPDIENAEKITLDLLLSHRTGIHNFTNDADYLTWNQEAKTEAEMLEIIKKGGSDFTPDSKAEYSNSNFLLLSYILEKTYKKSYGDILNKYIIVPLQLQHTYLGGAINAKQNEAYSYSFMGDWKKENETDISIPLGAGGIVSTPSDLLLFSKALFKGKLVSATSLERMKTLRDNYGMGLFQFPFNGNFGYGHTGGIDGFSSIFSYFKEDNLAYALCSNGNNYNANEISIAVLSAALNQPFTIPSFTSYQAEASELEQYVGVYASMQMPLKITITTKDGRLFGQATGQAAFPLEATAKDIYKFNLAGLVMEFTPQENSLILKQGGGEFLFKKEE
jgi:D-alanyl-D-alanine carboxypeptidase